MPRTRAAQDRHNELRRRSRGKARKAIFIAEYVEVKYSNIFKEAEGLFNMLDEKYKDKYDLRKTDEFLFFKLTMEGKYGFCLETGKACESLPAETATACESLPAETATACESLSAETATACESLPAETATACESLPAETATACESLPAETATACESLSAETATTCESLLSQVVMDSESLPAEKVLSPVTKQLQLEIDLMTEQQVREATVTTQTLSVITEQEAPPISFGDIPVDMIDQIIFQLRQDPDLTEIFNDIDLQMEFEQLGEDFGHPSDEFTGGRTVLVKTFAL